MLRQKTNKAFTIIEILVVIVIIIIFIIFAAPNVSSYLADREVKKEVNSFVKYLKEKKAEVQENDKCLKVALDKVIFDLDNSIEEEKMLTLEYAQLINTVDSCIVLSEDIDNVLFSSLTSANENE